MIPRRRHTARARTFLFAAVALSGAGELHAQLWDGGHSSSDNWGSGLNWEPNGPPANNGSANIIMSGTVRPTPNVNDPWDINSLKFNSSAGAFVTDGSPLIIRGGGIENSSSNLQVFDNKIFPRNSQTWDAFAGPMVFNALIEGFNGSPTLTVDGAYDVTFNGNVAESGVTLGLSKTGSGTLTLNGEANTYSGPTTVDAGKMLVVSSLTASSSVAVSGGTLELATAGGSNRVIKTSSLSISGSGKLDLTDNKLIVTATGVASITGLIASGRNGGNWSGGGIVTSQTHATTGNYTSIGVATAAQVKAIATAATAVWAGQTVTGSDSLVMYTYGGDANLDGKINIDDYGHIDTSVGTGLTGWFNGDFNHDGKINIDDYGIIDVNVGIQGAPFPTAIGGSPMVGLVSVPEPMLLTTAATPLALLISSRRQRKRA